MGVERRGCVVQGVFIDQPEMGGINEYRQAIRLAEQWEPDESRGSRTVLPAAGGEIPPADSPGYPKTEKKSQKSTDHSLRLGPAIYRRNLQLIVKDRGQ